MTEEEYFEQLLNEADEDAALVADYESALAETVQTDEDLAAAYTSYSEARKRLSDRFKSRGFWRLGPTKGKVNHQATRVVVSLVENSPRSRCNNGYLKVHAASAVSQGIGKLSVQKDLKLA